MLRKRLKPYDATYLLQDEDTALPVHFNEESSFTKEATFCESTRITTSKNWHHGPFSDHTEASKNTKASMFLQNDEDSFMDSVEDSELMLECQQFQEFIVAEEHLLIDLAAG